MFGSVVLEIAVGLAYLYLLLSTMCSALNEGIAGLLALRSKNLRMAIEGLLDESTVAAIYSHPLVQGLSATKRLPSYIPARVFASALLDVLHLADVATAPAATAAVRQRVDAIPSPQIRRALGALANQAAETASGFRRAIEVWYHDAMDRASGTYKRRVQVIICVLAGLITVVLNADSLMIANRLAENPALLARVTSAAQTAVQPEAPAGRAAPPTEPAAEAALAALRLPIGWSLDRADPRGVPRDLGALLGKLLGLLFTVVAVSLGAPFWFDFLGRIVNLRLSGQPPEPPGTGPPQPIHLVAVAPGGTAAPAAAPAGPAAGAPR